jgi:hypothetical protein
MKTQYKFQKPFYSPGLIVFFLLTIIVTNKFLVLPKYIDTTIAHTTDPAEVEFHDVVLSSLQLWQKSIAKSELDERQCSFSGNLSSTTIDPLTGEISQVLDTCTSPCELTDPFDCYWHYDPCPNLVCSPILPKTERHYRCT